uniref:hypothetical protein n=1 Tax=Prevotella sp. TaxID=59823 RepID=UPI004029EE1A
MEITIMDYQTGTVRTIKGCPDEWETEQIEYYLYETLGYRSSDIYYMCGEAISHTEDTYVPQPEKPTLYKKWTEIRKEHPDCLLLFRVGDYYECYNEDAVKAAEILGTTLINRHTKELNKMTGFPYDSLDKYLPKLIRASQRVVICDQLTTPQK